MSASALVNLDLEKASPTAAATAATAATALKAVQIKQIHNHKTCDKESVERQTKCDETPTSDLHSEEKPRDSDKINKSPTLQPQQQPKKCSKHPTFGSVKHFVPSKQQLQLQQQNQKRNLSRNHLRDFSSLSCDDRNLPRRVFFNQSIDMELRIDSELRSPSSSSRLSSVLVSPRKSVLANKKINLKPQGVRYLYKLKIAILFLSLFGRLVFLIKLWQPVTTNSISEMGLPML